MSQLSPGTMIVSVFAVLFGLVGAYSVRRYMEPPEVKKEEAQAPQRMILPIASSDLKPGRRLTLGDIQILRLTSDELAKRKDVPNEYMANPRQLIGRYIKTDIKKGGFFQIADLYAEGTGPSIAERLKKGFRAVTIKCEATGLLNGLAKAGHRVDVIFRSTATPAADETKAEIPEATITLLDNVEILAVGQNAVRSSTSVVELATVTLAVSPKQASILKVAEGRGAFSLSLRSDSDEASAQKSDPQTIEQLLNVKPKVTVKEKEKEKEKPFTTEIYRGNSRSKKVYSQDQVLNETFAPNRAQVSGKVYRKEQPSDKKVSPAKS